MTCSEAKLKLEPCATGTLPPDEKIALEEHLATCEGCRLELELTRAVLGSSAVENTGGFAPSGAEPHAVDAGDPASSAAPSALGTPDPFEPAKGFEPPTAAEIDAEISFADLSLEESPPKMSANPPPAEVAATKEPAPSKAGPSPGVAASGAAGAKLWDFEPVDAHRDVGPPEGSLSFAKEALTRKRDEEQRRKATLLRLTLWGGGIFGGVLLLGISVWIALAFRQGESTRHPPVVTGTPTTGTAQEPAPTEGGTPVATPTTADSSGAASLGSGAGTTPAPAEDVATTPPATTATPAPGLAQAPEHVAQGAAPPAGAQPAAAKKPAPKPPKPAVKPTPKPAPRDASHGGSDEVPAWSPSDLQPAPPSAMKPVGKAPGVAPPGSAPVPPASGQGESPSPSPPQPNSGGGSVGQTPPASSPQTSPNPAAAVPPPTAGAPGEPTPGGDGAPATPAPNRVTRPIDRLHLATATATENQDLVTLRKLKDSWKSFLKSAAGPDRSRSKRELADCLWAIQEITSRAGDRKEALAAYRDYILTSPAGGNDSRSLSRMRYLEESLGGDK